MLLMAIALVQAKKYVTIIDPSSLELDKVKQYMGYIDVHNGRSPLFYCEFCLTFSFARY